MKNDNSKTPILNIENTSETSDQRRNFLKQVVISGTGAVTFVKSASAASSEGAVPSIISLLLEDEAAFDPSISTFNPPEQFESNQDIDIPAGAKFMQVEASGAGGGGSASTAALENSLFTAGVNGGAGGRATATYNIEQFSGSQLIARVGTGGGASVGNAVGGPGQFGGGTGGGNEVAIAGAGGGGLAGMFQEGDPLIVAGGGGGGGGGRFFSGQVFSGGRGGSAGARGAANRRAGEDGTNAEGASSSGGTGGNRQIVNGVSVATRDSLGGQGGNGGGGSLDGATGVDPRGGNGGSSNDDGSGGGGGAGFFCAESNEDCSGAGGGGGAGAAGGGGGGGAGGTNFIDTVRIQPLAGFNDDVGPGGAGGQGGLSGEAAETSAADRAAEPGAPAQLVVTFFAKNPNA